MLQKIKYPVGSKLKNNVGEVIILDVTKNELACFVFKDKDYRLGSWYSQAELDFYDYTLVSSPRWIPRIDEVYFFINNYGGNGREIWRGDSMDLFRLKSDNVFENPEECQKKIDEINSREI